MGSLLKRRRQMASSLVKMELIFEILTDGDIIWKATSNNIAKTIQYSRNGRPWQTITATTEGVVIPVRAGEIIGWQGHNTSYAAAGETEEWREPGEYNSWGSSTATFNVRGNIMALVDEEEFESKTTLVSPFTFARLFSGSKVVDASGLRLIATTLSENCYRSMFSGCNMLTALPNLPATTVTPSCYRGMFEGCTSLTTSSVLPALVAQENCYDYMFSGCTSLTTINMPAATTLATYCYNGMFSGCTSLVNVPNLPAATTAQHCYINMFKNCTSIVTAPRILSTVMADSCCLDMFENCTGLTTATNAVSAVTTLEFGCFREMFKGCSSLVNAPSLPLLTTAKACYRGMFMDCTSLQNAPTLPATYITESCYLEMFKGCTSLQTAPDLLFDALTQHFDHGALYACGEMFMGCSSLNFIRSYTDHTTGLNWNTDWVKGVAATGTFVKKAGATWPSGDSGIPIGWTVIEE